MKMHKTCEHVWVVLYDNNNDIYFNFPPSFYMYPTTLVGSMLIILFSEMLNFFPNDKKMWRQILKLWKLINLLTKMCWNYNRGINWGRGKLYFSSLEYMGCVGRACGGCGPCYWRSLLLQWCSIGWHGRVCGFSQGSCVATHGVVLFF